MFDLLYASAVGDEAGVKHCLARGESAGFLWGEITRTCAVGRTALHYAILGGHNHVIAHLMKAGADINAQDRDGFTAAMCAAKKDNYKALDVLIKAGANLAIRARDGTSALHLAAGGGHAWSVTLLLGAGCAPGALDLVGSTPLLAACTHGHLNVAKLLIQAGAKVNTGSVHSNKDSPLHKATALGHVELVRLLLKHKALVNWADKQGSNPMHVCAAAITSNPEYIGNMRTIAALFLANKKMDINARDNASRSYWDLAHDVEIKRMIREALAGVPPPVKVASDDDTHTHHRLQPLVVQPHPTIPGHRWADAARTPCIEPGQPISTPWAQDGYTPLAGLGSNSHMTPKADPPPCASPSSGASGYSDSTNAECVRDAYKVVPPWALDGKYEDFTTSIRRAPQLQHEREVWAAVAPVAASPRSPHARRRIADLQASDVTWFDTAEGYLHQYPPRRCWGRYAS